MKDEHVMEKELVLSDKAHEKLEYNKCLKSLQSWTISSTLVTGFNSLYKIYFRSWKSGSNLLKIDNHNCL